VCVLSGEPQLRGIRIETEAILLTSSTPNLKPQEYGESGELPPGLIWHSPFDFIWCNNDIKFSSTIFIFQMFRTNTILSNNVSELGIYFKELTCWLLFTIIIISKLPMHDIVIIYMIQWLSGLILSESEFVSACP
jgi:hypothetical protein